MLPLWVQVTKDGLETRIVFQGEWVFTNHLPQEVQVRVRYLPQCLSTKLDEFCERTEFVRCCWAGWTRETGTSMRLRSDLTSLSFGLFLSDMLPFRCTCTPGPMLVVFSPPGSPVQRGRSRRRP